MEEQPQGLDVPPKILYLDIETALMSVDIYDLYIPNKRITKDAIERNKFVINWAAAWVENGTYKIKGKILSGVCTQKEAKKQNDKRILQPLFDLMDESDYICGHNVQGFDVKILKWRFLYHGMGYPSASKIVDTFKLSGAGRPESRGLDYLLRALGHNGKRHELDLSQWREIVHKGTPALLAKSDRYCRADVRGGVDLLREYAHAEEQGGRVLFR
jgi:hypothetical protein